MREGKRGALKLQAKKETVPKMLEVRKRRGIVKKTRKAMKKEWRLKKVYGRAGSVLRKKTKEKLVTDCRFIIMKRCCRKNSYVYGT